MIVAHLPKRNKAGWNGFELKCPRQKVRLALHSG